MKPYVVKQGDFLDKIAFKMGFDAGEVWGDGANADLKKKRKTGDVLLPGDILYVPEDPRKKLPFTKETKNAYKAKLPTVKVEVVLAAPGGAPLANEPYVIKGLGDESEKTTGADGKVKIEASIEVRQVEVVLTKRKRSLVVRVGDLDPVDEPSGARMRLQHLGLYAATFATDGGATYASRDDAQLAAAIRAFQLQKGLPTSGALDDATKAALVDAHGS
jgi:hypothetical protein